jgi:tetratricopeptide (TPR) repeat protein
MTLNSSEASGFQAIIDRANKAYSEGLYANSIDLYKEVLKNGYESSELYYNIGNAYYKLNDYSSAILYYERGNRLDPGNEDINFNLKIVNNKIADKIEPLPELFYKRWYNALIRLFSLDTWAKTVVILFLLSIFMASVYFISRILILRKISFWLSIILFFSFLFTMLTAVQSYTLLKNQHEAIVFSPTITVKSSPDEKSIDLFVIHEGTKVSIIDQIGNWYEIRIANGSVGWLQSSAIEKI